MLSSKLISGIEYLLVFKILFDNIYRYINIIKINTYNKVYLAKPILYGNPNKKIILHQSF